MFPFLCEMVDRDDKEQFGRVLTQSGRMLLSVFIPLSLVCVVLARPLTFLIFHGGKFSAESAYWTSVSTACYTLVLPAAALEYILMQAFFAHRRMVAVTVIGVVFTVLSMVISYVGVVVFGATGVAALAVIALGFVLSRVLKSAALIVLLRRNVDVFPPRGTLAFVLRALAAGVAAAGLCHLAIIGFDRYVTSGGAKLAEIARLALGGGGAAVGFVVAMRVVGLEEPVEMLRWGVERVRERRGGRTARDGAGE
jgi:putative peptidoglycan lipid II flippase